MQSVAFITGAGSGIGRATAIELSGRGYRLALCGRRLEPLRSLVSELPSDAIALQVDVADPLQVEHAVADAAKKFERIDAAVNCAGLAPALSVQDTTPQQWRDVLDTNLSGAFYVCRSVWPVFRSQQSGVIVNVSSMAARDPYPNFAAYAAAKAGLNSLTLTLAREGQPLGIVVHGVAPGAVETPMLRSLLSEEQMPATETLEAADVAAIIARCVTGELRHSSGETIYLQRKL